MQITDLIRRSGRSIKSARGRTLLTALAIAVGTFSLTLTLAASNGAQAFVDQIIRDNFNPSELIVAADDRLFGQNGQQTEPIEYDPSFTGSASPAGVRIAIQQLDESDREAIANITGVEAIRRDIAINTQYITRANQPRYIAVVAAYENFRNPRVIAGSISTPPTDGTILIPEGFIEPLGFASADAAIGQEITVALLDNTRVNSSPPAAEEFDITETITDAIIEESFIISAVLEQATTSQPGTELNLFVSLRDAERLVDIATRGTLEYQRDTFVYALVEGGEDEAILREVQNRIAAEGYNVQSVSDTQEFLNQIINVLQGIVAAFGAIAIIASIFGIINTMYISVLQRTREIGLMKALGMRSRDVGRLFRFEAAWIGLLGSLIGSLGAVAIGLLLNPWITERLSLGEDNVLLIFKTEQILGLIAGLVIIAILAGWLPSRKAMKLNPIEALRTE
jgi:putative ABC transport system permease protein